MARKNESDRVSNKRDGDSIHIIGAVCPVCGKYVRLTQQQSLSENRVLVPWFSTYAGMLQAIEEGSAKDPHSDRKIIHWACDNCIRTGKALLADPREQQFCDCYPYLAYFDEQRQCEECGASYVFDKGEQKHWYEILKFWVQSRPKCCKDCYKKKHPQK
jgi:hypothetical protein